MIGVSKLIGGFLGFLVGGPLGALLGLLIGHIFDRHFTKPNGTIGHYTSRGELIKAYRLLDITSDITAEEIKQAYRRSMQRYHPDRLSNHLSPEAHQASIQKIQQIQKAYILICKARNIQ